MYGQLWNVGTIYALFIVLSLVWCLALIYIMFDADELYGTGWFWFLLVLLVPLIAIPAYGLMKLGTHRSWKDEMAALDRQEHKRALGQRFSGIALDLDRQLGTGAVQVSDGDDTETAPATGFIPFRPVFAAPAEAWRRHLNRQTGRNPGDTAQTGRQAAPGPGDGTTTDESSSQGCGDSTKGREINERLSWRHKHQPVQSRWTPARSGGLAAATREEMPF